MAEKYRNPYPTVDIIIEVPDDQGVVLIERKNPPHGWAIPGGFIDYGESAPNAAIREAKEETSLDVVLTELFHVYSDPKRDPRSHTMSTVYIARIDSGTMEAADDAISIGVFNEHNLPGLVFDHKLVLDDYFYYKKHGKKQNPV